MKQNIREQLDALLDIGFASSDETSGFREVKHESYVEAMQQWLHSYGSNWAEQPRLTNLQGLNDRGVDLKVEFEAVSYSVGFQIKSHGDIDDKDFSTGLAAIGRNYIDSMTVIRMSLPDSVVI
jgi:hypothetical protein